MNLTLLLLNLSDSPLQSRLVFFFAISNGHCVHFGQQYDKEGPWLLGT